MKRMEDPRRCDACGRFDHCLSVSMLRVLAELHDMVGVVMVNAGMAQGVDQKGRPLQPRRVVAAGGPVPIPRPLPPV